VQTPSAVGRWPIARLAPAGVLDTLPPRLRPDARLGVLDITKYFGTTSGGIKTYLLEKARYVGPRPALRQVMVVPGPEDEVATGDGSRTYRLRGPRIPAHDPYRFLLATRSLRRILEHESPDLIEVGSPFLVPWLTKLANRRLRAPIVWYYHSHLPRLAAPDPSAATVTRRAASHLLSRYVRLLGDQFPVVFCASQFSASVLTAQGVDRVVRVPLGVDVHHFSPDRREHRCATRQRVGLWSGPVALFAGRFAAEKRLDVILEAWPEVERRTGCRLALLGGGPAAESLRRHRHANRVTWLPWEGDRERFADILAAVDVYVAPGPAETFGLSALEAMASGTPVLSVDSGAVSELVIRGDAGQLFADGCVDSVITSATQLLAGDLVAAGARARRLAERDHAWDHVLGTLFARYADLVEGRPLPFA
jgi:alpha-1,6-mannosyltransferase